MSWKQQEFTYLGDSVSAGGGSMAAMIARTRCGWVSIRGLWLVTVWKRFLVKLKKMLSGAM